jgi:hypothetical protein
MVTDKIIVVGGTPQRRKMVSTTIKSVLNNDFTSKERSNIGVVYSNLDRKLPGKYAADTGSVPLLKGMKTPGHHTMVDLRIGKGLNKTDLHQAILHEFVHQNRKREGENYKNERRTDLEVVGRLPASGIRNMKLGYYFDTRLRFPPHTSLPKKISLVREQIRQDRRMLTGSVNKSLEGERLEKKVDALYRQSGIAKRRKYP